MKRLWLVLLLFLFAPRANAQGTQIASYASDPPTCNSSRGILEYNTTTQAIKICGPSANTWTPIPLAVGGGSINGSATLGQVAVGSGTNSIGSSVNLLFNVSQGLTVTSTTSSGRLLLVPNTGSTFQTILGAGNTGQFQITPPINIAPIIAMNPTFGFELFPNGTAPVQLTLDGTSSGHAILGAAAAAGTPNRMNLPTTTGGANQGLITDGGNPQQLSWGNVVSSLTGDGTVITNSGSTGAVTLTTPGTTGTGTIVLSTNPTLTTPNLGTPSAVTLTNGTGYLLNNIASATGTTTLANGNNPQTWNWAQTTNTQAGITFGETSAATNGTITNHSPNQSVVKLATLSGTTEAALTATGTNSTATNVPLVAFTQTYNNASVAPEPYVFRTIETSTANGNIFSVWGGATGTTDQFSISAAVGGPTMTLLNAFNLQSSAGTFRLFNSSATAPVQVTAGGYIAQDGVGAGATFGSNLDFKPIACETNFAVTNVNTGSATTTTGLACLPANAIILSVEYRITTTITTAASFTVGDGTTAARFCATQNTMTAGTTASCFVPWTSATAGTMGQAAAANVVVTFNATPGAGAIRLIVYGIVMTPPTS